ncbi:MAG: 50S ribosomal protein L10 [Polyangiaceae bacterium]|nr:50S ribosomal protein L10 [Polyangiaceae bacterium]
MERASKQAIIDDMQKRFDRMVSAVFIDFNGLDVAGATNLRDELRKAKVDYKVVKNTLLKLAAKKRGWNDVLGTTLRGMTGVALSYDEPGAAAKVLREFAKKNQKMRIKAGLVDGQLITGEAVVSQLATMPGKDELRAKLLATFQAPAQQFVQQLQAAAQNFVYLLKAKSDQA